MTTQDTGSVTATIVTTKEQSFLDDKLKLDKLLRSLGTASKAAITALEDALKSQDEKVRVAAADKLLAFYIATAKEVNNDQIQRLIAEIKLNGGGTKKLVPLSNDPEARGGKSRPLVDFGTIREV